MSTKIYSGFKAKNVGAKQLMCDLIDIQTEARKIANELSWNYQMFYAVTLFDKVSLGLAEAPKSSYLGEARAAQLTAQQESERTNERNREVDYSFSICVYPVKNNEFLGLWFTEWESKYTPLIKSKPWYQEYGYWNNTDKPEHLSNREWNKRRKDWEILRWGTPANECMLTLECVKCVEFGNWITSDSQVELLSFEERLGIASNRELRNRQTVGYWDFIKNLKNGDYQNELEEIKKELSLKLVKDLTLYDLCAK
jgi:hypothetical protein